MIFLLLERSTWDGCADVVAAPGQDGYVHCCDEAQIAYVRERYFAADAEVLALAFDPTQLEAETRYEAGAGGEPERFPHVYGELPRSGVVSARAVD
jgi:uncharacterized protein (DUF952 family)